MSQPITESTIRDALASVWRNLPQTPSTFSRCARKCDGSAGGRGGGICIRCAQTDLAELIGDGMLASEYVQTVKRLRAMEAQILSHANSL